MSTYPIVNPIPGNLRAPTIIDASELEWHPGDELGSDCGSDCGGDCGPCSEEAAISDAQTMYPERMDAGAGVIRRSSGRVFQEDDPDSLVVVRGDPPRPGRIVAELPPAPPPRGTDVLLGGDPFYPPTPTPAPGNLVDQPPPPTDDLFFGDPYYPPTEVPPWQADDFARECRIVPRPPPRVNPDIGELPGGKTGQVGLGLDGGSIGAFTMQGTTSAAGQAADAADDLFTTASPLCPLGYSFDYDWQACYPDGDGPSPPSPDDLYKYACECPADEESWVIGGHHDGECYEWGTGDQHAGHIPQPGEVVFEQDCPVGHWDPVLGRCALEPCPAGQLELDGECVDIDQEAINFVCLSADVLEEPSSWEIDTHNHGPGKCVGSDYTDVWIAFDRAYRAVRIAELELDHLATLSNNTLVELWFAYDHIEVSSLAWWFGGLVWNAGPIDVGPFEIVPTIQGRLYVVREIVKAVSHAFRNGFKSGHHPVRVWCKSHVCVGGPHTAKHVLKNMVEICPEWYDLFDEARARAVLHEMCHWAMGAHPRDRNNDLCTGNGTNCYDRSYWVEDPETGLFYKSGEIENDEGTELTNPRKLVLAFEAGNVSAFKDMMLNIDNYASWMWNRWVDRGLCRLNGLAW